MAEKNGKAKGNADAAHQRQELQVATLRGDIRDQMLRLVRDLPNHWPKMTGDAQQDVITRIELMANDLVNRVVDMVSSRGCSFQLVTLGEITITPTAIKCKFTVPRSAETAAALNARIGQTVVLVAREAEQFAGERAPAQTDNVGDLAIPRAELGEETRVMHG